MAKFTRLKPISSERDDLKLQDQNISHVVASYRFMRRGYDMIGRSDADRLKHKAYTGVRADVASMIIGRPTQALDIGCSNGDYLKFVKHKQGVEYTVGVEFDGELIQETMGNTDEIVAADLDAFDVSALSGRKFDMIVLADVLEHTKDSQPPGGRFQAGAVAARSEAFSSACWISAVIGPKGIESDQLRTSSG